MPEYDDTNTGVLFFNDRKTEEWHGEWTGKINVNGTMHYFAEWDKVDRNGKPYRRVKIGKPVQQRGDV